jgi:hypothetical protein
MTLVVGPNYRLLVLSCAAAIAVADFLAWFGRPLTAVFMVGLGALAGAIFAPAERRLWVITGTGYAGGMVLARYFYGRTPGSDLRWSCCSLRSSGQPTSSAILPDGLSGARNCGRL